MKEPKETRQTQMMKIPAVNTVLQSPALNEYRQTLRHDILKNVVRSVLDRLRHNPEASIAEADAVKLVADEIRKLLKPSLQGLINATGVILNTNLGRAPLGDSLLQDIYPVVNAYSNLEFDTLKGERGSRNVHLKKLTNAILNCEESVVVNNNAAALFLTLTAMTCGKEVIISRGELVEIGGSFRIPDILKASGALMVEVGTTNKTKLNDYENAITENTGAILKVHKSNYYIKGFTAEVSVREISQLAKKHNLLSIFDLGTGLADRTLISGVDNEPDIRTALEDGTDIITFSCDKLLGGPQGGIIAGKSEYLKVIAKHPLMRILRVDKLIISALCSTLQTLLYNNEIVVQKIPLFRYLNRNQADLTILAEKLASKIKNKSLTVSITANEARCGGGTLPDHIIPSKAVLIECLQHGKAAATPEDMYYQLLQRDYPIVGILKEGKLLFDVITLEDKDIEEIAAALNTL